MKKLLFIILLTSISTISYSQKTVFSEEKTDDMTGNRVIKTHWLKMKMEWSKVYYMRICKINDYVYLDLKVVVGQVVSVPKDSKFILKFYNDSVMTLYNVEYELSNLGRGAIGLNGSEALGVNPHYSLSTDQLEILSNSNIVKVRLYFSDSFIETEIKSKVAKEFCKYGKALLLK